MSYAPYSYSKLGVYKQCPAKFSFKYRDKFHVERTTSPQMSRGLAMHESIEHYLLQQTDMLHEELNEKFGLYFMNLRADYECMPERKFCFNKNWSVVDWDDPDGYIRGIMDNVYMHDKTLVVQDWKTGKVYDDHAEQRELYAMLGMLEFPADNVNVQNVYLDQRYPYVSQSFSRENLPALQLKWTQKIEQLEADENMIPMPQYLCRWCPYSSVHNEGDRPCRF